MLTDILWVLFTTIILWFVIVFALYTLFTVGIFKNSSPSAIIRILYGVYSIVVFLYLMSKWSPFANSVQPGTTGFVVGLVVLALLLISLVVTGIQKTQRGGSPNA